MVVAPYYEPLSLDETVEYLRTVPAAVDLAPAYPLPAALQRSPAVVTPGSQVRVQDCPVVMARRSAVPDPRPASVSDPPAEAAVSDPPAEAAVSDPPAEAVISPRPAVHAPRPELTLAAPAAAGVSAAW